MDILKHNAKLQIYTYFLKILTALSTSFKEHIPVDISVVFFCFVTASNKGKFVIMHSYFIILKFKIIHKF